MTQLKISLDNIVNLHVIIDVLKSLAKTKTNNNKSH